MKKIFSIILCAAAVMLSGCSSISQDEYNSLVEEKTSLKYDNEKLQGEIADLQSELDTIKAEKSELEQKNVEAQAKIDAIDYCFDIDACMLGRPQSSIIQSEVSKYNDNVDLETAIYMEGTHFTSKMVHTIKDTVSPALTAIHIVSYEKAIADGIGNLLDDNLKEYVIIYRNYNDGHGSVIMHSYWYLDDNDEMHHDFFFTLYAQKQGIVDEYKRIVENQ